MGDLSRAVENVRKITFKQYHDLAVKAGEKGAVFNTDTVTSKLLSVSEDLKFNPQVRAYAKRLIPQVEKLRGQPPEIIEARIKDLNNSLEGFYNGRVAKAKAEVDASVANLLRSELDGMIEKSAGKTYQQLKNQYGNLKTLEKDLNHRLIVEARKSPKGLIDLTDIFSGGQIIRGLFSLDPAFIASGLAQKGIMSWIKKVNSPDYMIKNLFNKIDMIYGGKTIPTRAINKKSANISNPEQLEQFRREQMETAINEYENESIGGLLKVIKSEGGISPYKNIQGAKRLKIEYAEEVPIHLRNKAGLKLDQMAKIIRENYPQFGIETESDLLAVLRAERKAKLK